MSYLYARYLIRKFEECFHRSLVLDVGCGKGGLGAIVKTIPEKNLGTTFIGLDVNLSLLQIARTFYDDVVCGSATNLPFRDRAFDATFCIEVIEHLDKKAVSYTHLTLPTN